MTLKGQSWLSTIRVIWRKKNSHNLMIPQFVDPLPMGKASSFLTGPDFIQQVPPAKSDQAKWVQPVVNFTNILWAAFLHIFFFQKMTRSYPQILCFTLSAVCQKDQRKSTGWKAAVECWWNWHLELISRTCLLTAFTRKDPKSAKI